MNIDLNSETWQVISKLIDDKLSLTTKRIIDHDTDYGTTQYYRGVYAALSLIKSLPDKEPVILVESSDY